MSEPANIFGCFVSVTAGEMNDTQEQKELSFEQGRLFRSYIWGEKGLIGRLKKMNNADYGKDLVLALFQFYINPISDETKKISSIEEYRKKERSIGIPIIVNDGNFFSKGENDRQAFIRTSMIQKLDLLEEVVKKKKLDTNMDQLRMDLVKILG